MTRQIRLTRGAVAIVDDDDYDLVRDYSWHLHRTRKTSYAVYTAPRSEAQRKVYMHRLLLNAPSGLQVDHKNGNGLDNRRCNIRLASNSQNHANIAHPQNSRTGYRGVHVHARTGKLWARIKVKGKTLFLGYFVNPVDAALAYDAAAREHFGEFSRTNFNAN